MRPFQIVIFGSATKIFESVTHRYDPSNVLIGNYGPTT
jgi:hypothetical protein